MSRWIAAILLWGVACAAPVARAASFAPEAWELASLDADVRHSHAEAAAQALSKIRPGQDYVQIGDMRYRTNDIRACSGFPGTRWPLGRVYFEFDPAVAPEDRDRWLSAAAAWSAVANVSFHERQGGQNNYIHIKNDDANYSYVGMTGGRQEMGILNWSRDFVIAHEIAHALGQTHEHQRSDRNDYLSIVWGNIAPGQEPDFQIAGGENYGGYDFDSLLHNARNAWSVNGGDTIETRPDYLSWLDLIGQRDHLSDLDKQGMAIRYGYTPLRLACTPPQFDDIGALLTAMGYEFDVIPSADLGDYERLRQYQAVFINCAAECAEYATSSAAALEKFVRNGGALYASDYAYAYIQAAMPGLIGFYDFPRLGSSGTVLAEVLDDGMADFAGAKMGAILFDEARWVPIKTAPAQGTVYLAGDISLLEGAENGGPPDGAPNAAPVHAGAASAPVQAAKTVSDSPLCVGTEYGQGYVIYTTFHNEKQLSDLTSFLLRYLILSGATAGAARDNEQALAGRGATAIRDNRGILDEGARRASTGADAIGPGHERPQFLYKAAKGRALEFSLNWMTSATLRLDVYDPQGVLYDSAQRSYPPVSLSVDAGAVASENVWTYRVTPVALSQSACPFALAAGQVLDPVRYQARYKNCSLQVEENGFRFYGSSARASIQIVRARKHAASAADKPGIHNFVSLQIPQLTVAGDADRIVSALPIRRLRVGGHLKSLTVTGGWVEQLSAASLGQVRMRARVNSSACAGAEVAGASIDADGPAGLPMRLSLDGVCLRRLRAPRQSVETVSVAARKWTSSGGEACLSAAGVGPEEFDCRSLGRLVCHGGPIAASHIRVRESPGPVEIKASGKTFSLGARPQPWTLAMPGDIAPGWIDVNAPSLTLFAQGGDIRAGAIQASHEIALMRAAWKPYINASGQTDIMGGVVGFRPEDGGRVMRVASGGGTLPSGVVQAADGRRPGASAPLVRAAPSRIYNIGKVFGDAAVSGVFSAGTYFAPDGWFFLMGDIGQFQVRPPAEVPAGFLAPGWWFQVSGKAYTRTKARVIPGDSDHLTQFYERQ